jgi:antitoxin (DNA-binding transcriptional repressor) of toxin-antitoxin stability system
MLLFPTAHFTRWPFQRGEILLRNVDRSDVETTMMVAERLTVADLTTGLTEVQERVSHGERFMIERDGEVIATLVSPDLGPGITWAEFIATYHERPRPDKRFADDLEAILAEREILSDPPEWPD